LKGRSQEPLGGTPEEVSALIRKELPKWEAVHKASGTTLD
jgi:tripartite-type tricarboxylate transporter receptor subunit TctC